MKFEVVIGNPPYQEATASIYQHFINKALNLQPRHITMIVKNNWMASDTLKDTRERMLQSGLKKIVNYPISGEVFPNVGVAVNIFHISLDYKGAVKINNVQKGKMINEFEFKPIGLPVIPINQIEYNIIHKVTANMKESFSKEVYPCECFRINSNMTVGRKNNKFKLDYSMIQTKDFNIAVACLLDGELEYKYINKDDIPIRRDLINKYKIISCARLSNNQNVITSIYALSPNSACSATFVPLYTSENKEMAYSAYTYICTKFFRFLVRLLCNGGMTNMSPYRFSLVPLQDFTYPWTDEKLYKKYNFSQEEIDHIESTIRPMQ